MNENKHVLLVPGAFGKITFQKRLEDDCGDRVKIRSADFQTGSLFFPSYEKCARVLDGFANGGFLNEQSTVVAHSAGTIAFIKYLTQNGMKLKKFVSVAGFTGTLRGGLNKRGLKNKLFHEHMLKHFGFNITEDVLLRASYLIGERHSFLSNDDHLIEEAELRRFAAALNSRPHFLPGFGHFSKTKGIEHIPELAEIIIK